MGNVIRRAGWIAVLLILPLTGVGALDFRFTSWMDWYGGVEPSEGFENLRTRVYMAPEWSGGIGNSSIEWQLAPRLWVQPLGEPSAIDPWDILFEGYLFFPFDNLELTVGQTLSSYGFADVMGPLNIAHSTSRAPFSLDEFFDSRRPDPLVRLTWFPTFEDTLELTYIPVGRRDRERPGPVELPQAGGRRVIWDDDPYILDEPHSVFLNYRRFGERFDIQVLYGWYVDRTPDFVVGDETLTPVYNRAQTAGVAWATRLAGGTFSQDIAFDLTRDFDGTNIGGKNSRLTVNSQLLLFLPADILSQFSLVYSWFPNHGNHDLLDGDAALTAYLAEEIQGFHLQPLEHIAFVIAHFERAFLRERLQTELNVGFFFSPEVYLAPRVSWSFSDNWMITAGADITLGDPPDEDLRRNPWNDNVYARMIFRY